MTPIPVTILTGFLGAGKTTLLERLLADPAFADTAVIVNEFGEIGLDHELIETADEDLIETTSGCLCCTVQGDVRKTVAALLERRAAGRVRSFRRIAIETTGLADPAPVLHTFLGEENGLEGVRLARVATVVDAVHGEATLDRFEEARRQAACADIVLLSKTDFAQDPASLRDVAALKDRIKQLNATTEIVDIRSDGVSPGDVFAEGGFALAGKGDDVLEWLRFEAAAHGRHGSHAHHHGHAHAHDPNRHGDDIEAHCIAFDAPLDPNGFWFALEMLRGFHGERLLRVKGLIALADAPDRPILLHGVQHVFSPPRRLDAWPSSDRRTRLVVISKGLPSEDIHGVFASVTSAHPQSLDAGR